mmetsp:Transcript_3130/g.2100  ORF Transcript_3130/g.2100 Transcript_3130/m.2100 type:complete len:207 (+) Transcript_3130:602-1222(+)|eukprot:CAMPEP_0202972338 /NCGR_PEP_ID=MMETSP1396-20130829/35570_1 /ASSEMBLY_ACC=CAM_ASM_000872 /TAXON_ID= /ORGANISM="Pseudokeronopsis sp., Strain Brazil" /LENGTH=206 /DNA_ID=CAMNT_0049702643 /DNA_START=808 /DNA_END=1428 /DNA_ORIENTATION=-
MVQGMFLLWICFFFFNGGGGKSITANKVRNQPSKIITNTLLSSTTAGLIALVLKPRVVGSESPLASYEPAAICNGILSGLVAVTAPCNNIEPYFAVMTGFVAGICYLVSCVVWKKLRVDDPLEASQVHGVAGLVGVLMVGMVDNDRGLITTGNPGLLGVQALGALALVLWPLVTIMPAFLLMKKIDRFRVNEVVEIIGLDVLQHEE